MSVNVTWENNERTIIRLTVSGRWQWCELHAAKAQIEAMLDTVDYPVNILACGSVFLSFVKRFHGIRSLPRDWYELIVSCSLLNLRL